MLSTLRGLPPLAILWRRAGRRFDARTLRERQIAIVALLALVLLVMDHFWLSAAFKAWYSAQTEQRQAQRTLAQLQQQLHQDQAQALARTLQDKAELATWRARVGLVARAAPELHEELVSSGGDGESTPRLQASVDLPRAVAARRSDGEAIARELALDLCRIPAEQRAHAGRDARRCVKALVAAAQEEGDASLEYRIDVFQNGSSVGKTVCNPLGRLSVKTGWVETNVGSSHTRRGMGNMSCELKLPSAGPTVVKTTLVFGKKPPNAALRKADLVIKQ